VATLQERKVTRVSPKGCSGLYKVSGRYSASKRYLREGAPHEKRRTETSQLWQKVDKDAVHCGEMEGSANLLGQVQHHLLRGSRGGIPSSGETVIKGGGRKKI